MIIAFLISFTACIVGAICGMGGGVIIKPVLDFIRFGTASQISFMSGCTVLAMTTYSVGKSLTAKKKVVEMKTVTPLAIGAAIGGIMGKSLFNVIKNLSGNKYYVSENGILYTKDLIKLLKKQKDSKVKNIMRQAYFVSENKPTVRSCICSFTCKRRSL